ncbi:MAG: hypothetical protein A2X86_20265 [Bdellovibrionales bacterium GWA2_49_15]|nr:MAG: hypothetical protein A2X86_20265 [Bdellovibrionales bacterium GWA2_49_15]HAZ11352.1 hypothetical protein [Bdellovibrionales bacterium]
MRDRGLTAWQIAICLSALNLLAIEICYSDTETGFDPNVIMREHSTLLHQCGSAGEKRPSLTAPGHSSSVAKEKTEIIRVGCTKKFLTQSGFDYDEIKNDLRKKCHEENTFESQTFEFQTIYESERRYTFACTAELKCYEFRKGTWSTSPMSFSFYEKIPVKGPIKP